MPRRLVTSEIFRNDKVSELDFIGRLFFIGVITNADDDGRVKGSVRYLKANIFPYDNIEPSVIIACRDKCHELGIISYYNVNGSEVIALTGWQEHQVIRADRYKPSTLPTPNGSYPEPQGIPSNNQEDTNGIPKGNPKDTNGMLKRREEKRREEKRREEKIYSLWNTQQIIQHKKLTDEIRRAITTALKDNTEEDICQAIVNYNEILKDPKYYFKYSWTLKDFLKRGLAKFSDITVARQNYLKDRDNGTHKQGAGELPTNYTDPASLRQKIEYEE